MENKLTEVKLIELDRDAIKRVTSVMRFLHADDGPPTPGCTCKVCEIKMLLAMISSKDPAYIDTLMAELRSKETEWKAKGVEGWRQSVIDYFDGPVKEHVVGILSKEFEAEHGPADGKKITISLGGDMPEGLLDNSDLKDIINMKPAKA